MRVVRRGVRSAGKNRAGRNWVGWNRVGWNWVGRNIVPLLLVPLAALLLWVAIWRVWLPPVGTSRAVVRTVTTVTASTSPTHKVTTVVKSSPASSPSRRSEALALLLIVLGTGTAVIAVFHDRIGSVELGKDGLKLDLTAAERDGAAELVGRLAGSGAGRMAYARGVERYLGALARLRPAPGIVSATPEPRAIGPAEARSLAGAIADELR
jgi:hypothetical protein